MRNNVRFLIAGCIAGLTACTSPTQATSVPAAKAIVPPTVEQPVCTSPVPPPMPSGEELLRVHNIPFSIVGHEETVLWLCTTQPRAVTSRDGVTSWERDNYAQETPCPETPIN